MEMKNRNTQYRLCTLVLLLMSVIGISAQDLSGVKIMINPGHGGFDSNDRNVLIYPFNYGDPKGFWESQSNLDKGLQLRTLLQNAGATVVMSRTTNTTNDDLPLSQIVGIANSSQADYMLSIHSNAGGGGSNHVLQLYAGVTPGDTHVYPTPTPCSEEGRQVSAIIANYQYSNELTSWSHGINVSGDKTFARKIMGWSNGYGVLRGLTVPGCISEGSMHDYIPETYRLMNMEYKWMEAWHFFKSFCDYYEAGNVPTGNIAGTIRDSRIKNDGSYVKLSGSDDQLLPLSGVQLTLNPGNLTYTTDDLYNGVYVFKQLQPGDYEVTATKEGYHMQKQTVTVKAGKMTYLKFKLNQVRANPPEVTNYSPHEDLTTPVSCASPIVFEFNYDVDVVSAEQAFSISPEVAGQITFEDSQHRMVFTPNMPYEKSTVYTVRLDKSLQHPDHLSMVEDFTFQFKTSDRNRLDMFAYSPRPDTKMYYDAPKFKFYFDKALVSDGVREQIKVFDASGNELAKNARSVRTNKLPTPYGSNEFSLVKDLVPGQTYKVEISTTLKDVEGLHFLDTYEYEFVASEIVENNQPVVETFENTDLIIYQAEESQHITSTHVARDSNPKLVGSYSYELKYQFDANEGGKAMFAFSNPSVNVTANKVIGAHIYGDLTSNDISLVFSSTQGDKDIHLTTLNFLGWHFAEADLATLGEGNYTLKGIKVTQSCCPLTEKGAFNIDQMLLYDELIYPSVGIDTVENKAAFTIEIPIKNRIIVESNGQIQQMRLYDLNGKCIRSTTLTEMPVNDVLPGSYILRLKVDEQWQSQVIVIQS
jgi:hypothetical protein